MGFKSSKKLQFSEDCLATPSVFNLNNICTEDLDYSDEDMNKI